MDRIDGRVQNYNTYCLRLLFCTSQRGFVSFNPNQMEPLSLNCISFFFVIVGTESFEMEINIYFLFVCDLNWFFFQK